jgi:alcohol dehydrogenase class IV
MLAGMEAARLAVDTVRDLSNDVGIPTSLREVGVTDAMLEALADDTMKAALGVALNPRRPTREEVLALFKQAMG